MNILTNWLNRIFTVILIININLSVPTQLYAQQTETLSIEEAYQLAKENYPLIKL